jgi:hypothetical protein
MISSPIGRKWYKGFRFLSSKEMLKKSKHQKKTHFHRVRDSSGRPFFAPTQNYFPLKHFGAKNGLERIARPERAWKGFSD